jgi:polar amino acid transport system permease protein/polar amino acid transport system substrate-binding protein
MNDLEAIEHLLARWEELRQRGQPASAEELCRKCPEHLEELRRGIEAILAMEGWLETTPCSAAGPGAVPSAAEMAERFPQFEFLEEIGRGGMGVVYKVRQRNLGRLAALKVLLPEIGRSAVFIKRFLREAQTLAQLNDANIVQIFESGQSGDLPYLVMEYVEGTSLRRKIKEGDVTPTEALRIVMQICSGLQSAHEEKVVHRDIKPENVLIDRKGRVRIADFGLAKLRKAGVGELTRSQQLMGTYDYMAPEAAEGARDIDHRADIYAVGVVLYELLTGKRPRGEYVPASRCIPVDARIDPIISRALAQKPADRFSSVEELKEAIEEIAAGNAPATREVKPPRLSRLALLGVLVFLGLGVAGIWYFWLQPGESGGSLRWGADPTGGAPYVFEAGSDRRYIGFEVDLADELARRLGLKSELVRRSWDVLPQDLQRGDIDLVLNGYEWSPDREQFMASTIPYYIYRIQLVVGPDSPIRDWKDLRQPAPGGKPWRVGVLGESAAHRYLETAYSKDTVTILPYSEEGSTGCFNMLGQPHPQLDATVQDSPMVRHYIQQKHGFQDLRIVGDAIRPGYYVIFVRHEDRKLREQLNAALLDALQDGTLKKILDRYGLWNDEQETLAEVARHWPPDISASRMGVIDYAWLLGRAALTTLLLACLSMPLAIVLGLAVALGRLYGPRWLAWLLAIYVEVLRGTPLLIQLFVLYYLLPHLGIGLPAFWAGVLGLAINYSAYEAEIYRAGLLAIPSGQMEAALSLGMSQRTALRRVIIPQAFRLVIPPVTNDFIALFKDTSICSVIAVLELAGRFRGLMVNHPGDLAKLSLLTAALYLMMSYPLSLLARRLEKKTPRVAA